MINSKWWSFLRNGSPINGQALELNGQKKESEAQDEPAPFRKEKIVYVDEPNVWILNDGLLRDEGVLFGLSGADITHKIAAINHYYDQQKAAPLSEKLYAESKLKEVEKDLKNVQNDIAEQERAKNQGSSISIQMPSAKVLRYLLGLTVMLVAAVGSYYLVDFYVTPVYGVLATCGIFFFGLFAQMTPVSSWLQTQEASEKVTKEQKIKEALLEVGPSVAATLLTAYLVYKQTSDPFLPLVVGLFLLFLFFFNGKLILGLSQTLVEEVRAFKKFLRERRQFLLKKNEGKDAINNLKEREGTLSKEINELEEKLQKASTKIAELEKENGNKVELFTSEYNLASHFATTIKPALHE